MMMNIQNLTPQQALQKVKQYCAYQERCHAETRNKLYGYGLNSSEVETIIALLIEENYLNEERFAMEFAGGKFRMKQWGRIKIKQALRLRQVSDFCIRKALGAIDAEAYRQTLEKQAAQKWKTLSREQNIFIKKKKTQDFLLQKGYESELIAEILVPAVNGKD
jgi:regulatory protein